MPRYAPDEYAMLVSRKLAKDQEQEKMREEKRQLRMRIEEHAMKASIDAKEKRRQEQYDLNKEKQKAYYDLLRERVKDTGTGGGGGAFFHPDSGKMVEIPTAGGDPDSDWKQEAQEKVQAKIQEEQFRKLEEKKQTRALTPPEQAQYNIAHKKIMGTVPKATSIGDAHGLTSDQQLQAAQIARRVGGVRGMQHIIPMVYEQMRQGKTMDDIEDNLRYASQSGQMTGTIRSAIQNVVMGASPKMQERTLDFVDDALAKGNFDEVKEVIKRTVLAQAPTVQKNQLVGSERTLEFLKEIQDELRTLEQSGINTNIFSGTGEQILKKLGTVKEPELHRIATKISAAIQKYRRSMSGVAFSVPESVEYAQMFPSISKTGILNTANIQGLRETLTGDLENIYGMYMGKSNYRELFGSDTENQSTSAPKNQQSSGYKIISSRPAR